MPRVLTPAEIDQFRNRLLDAAAKLYFEMGHGDFNMRDLAACVGVSAMTPYRYFDDKDGILAAVRARGMARLADQLEAASPQGGAVVVQAYINFAMLETAYYRLIFDLSQSPAPLTEMARQKCRILSAISGAVAGGRSFSQPETLASSLWAALHGAICLMLAGTLSQSELGELVSQLALALLGVNQRFSVPPIQAPPERQETIKYGSASLHLAVAANIAAE